MIQIQSIRLKNFRLFQDEYFALKPLTVLTGPNSSGKSSIVKAMMLLQDNLLRNELNKLEFNGGDHHLGSFESCLFKKNGKQASQMEFSLEFKGQHYKDLINSNSIFVEYTFKPDKKSNNKEGYLSHLKVYNKCASFFEFREINTGWELRINTTYIFSNQIKTIKSPEIDPELIMSKFPFGERFYQQIQEVENHIIDKDIKEWESIHKRYENEDTGDASIEKEKKRIEKEKEKFLEKERKLTLKEKKELTSLNSKYSQTEKFLDEVVQIIGQKLDTRSWIKNKEDLIPIFIKNINDLQKKIDDLKIPKNPLISKTILQEDLKAFEGEVTKKLLKENKHNANESIQEINESREKLIDRLEKIHEDNFQEQLKNIEEKYKKEYDEINSCIIQLETNLHKEVDVLIQEKIKELVNRKESLNIHKLISGSLKKFTENILFPAFLNNLGNLHELKHSGYPKDKPVSEIISIENGDWEVKIKAFCDNILERKIGEIILNDLEDTIVQLILVRYFDIKVKDIYGVDFFEKPITKFFKNLFQFQKSFLSVIPAFRGLQQRYYDSQKVEYPLQYSLALLYSWSQKKDSISNQKLDFVNKAIKLFGIGDDIVCKLEDGSFVSAWIYSNNSGTHLADLGLGMTQLIPIIIQTADRIGQKGIVYIEEPGTHLHPDLQARLIEFLLLSNKNYNILFIIETHSGIFLKALHHLVEDSILTNKELAIYGLKETKKKINTISIDKNTGLEPQFIKYWENFFDKFTIQEFRSKESKESELQQLRHSLANLPNKVRCLVITEDSKKDVLSHILKRNGFNLDADEVEIRSFHGCNNVQIAIGMANIAEGLYPNLKKIIIHLDSDAGKNNKENFESINERFKLKNTELFLTKYNDLESYFISKEHISRLYPYINENEANEIINECTESLKDQRIDQLAKKLRLAKAAAKDLYESNVEKYRHGKGVKKEINKALNNKAINKSHDIIRYSDFIIKDDFLNGMASQLWPE